ncbi:MAG: pyridoxal kinase, partial [Myxococcota bacterium]
MTRPIVLSIQSFVAYGHVGNAAATFPLRRLGVDVVALNTVTFSSHPGYAGWKGRVHPASELTDLLDGLEDSGLLATCTAVLSGYQGSHENAHVTLQAVRRVRAHHPDALYVCDPVIGDHGRVYVDPALPDFFAEDAAPTADILVPNAFEASLLSGVPITHDASARRAADILQAAQGGAVLITGVVWPHDGVPHQHVYVTTPGGQWRVRAPHIERVFVGTGDAFTALLTGWVLRGAGHPQGPPNAAGAEGASVDDKPPPKKPQRCQCGAP